MIAALLAAAAVATTPAPTGKISTTPSLWSASIYDSSRALETWERAKPTQIAIVSGAKTLLTFTTDGKIVLGPGLSKDEATQQAVEALRNAYRSQFEEMARSTCRLDVLYERCPKGSRCTYTEEPLP